MNRFQWNSKLKLLLQSRFEPRGRFLLLFVRLFVCYPGHSETVSQLILIFFLFTLGQTNDIFSKSFWNFQGFTSLPWQKVGRIWLGFAGNPSIFQISPLFACISLQFFPSLSLYSNDKFLIFPRWFGLFLIHFSWTWICWKPLKLTEMTRFFPFFLSFFPSDIYRCNANFKFFPLCFGLLSLDISFIHFVCLICLFVCLFVKLDTYLAYLSQISLYMTPEFDVVFAPPSNSPRNSGFSCLVMR